MKVRLLQSWSQWSKGHVFTEMPGNQARTLIERHIAEQVVDATPSGGYLDRVMRPASARRARR